MVFDDTLMARETPADTIPAGAARAAVVATGRRDRNVNARDARVDERGLASAGIWFEEDAIPAAGPRLRVDRILVDRRSAFQHILVFENELFGRVLALDGVIQTTERDEFIYHEMMAHVPILAHGAARRVLIVGGGDGGTLEEVLKHRSIERATLVEIDAAVVETSRRHLPTISNGAFDDPRAELIIADGMMFVGSTDRRYDVIIVDSTDSTGPGESLFSAEFYARCKRRLAPGGIIVTQASNPFFHPEVIRTTATRLRASFGDVTAFVAAIPAYYSGPMAFGWGTDDPTRRHEAMPHLAARFAAARLDTGYYNPAIHAAAFVLPAFIGGLLSAGVRVADRTAARLLNGPSKRPQADLSRRKSASSPAPGQDRATRAQVSVRHDAMTPS